MLKINEFGLEDHDSGDAYLLAGQQRVMIEMTDAIALEMSKGGKIDSMVASGGASRRTGYKGSV